MKVIVDVRESEFLKRTYTIECGNGNQYISWLAQSACLLFGKEHYPPGIYIPNSLSKEDIYPHPR